MKATIQELQALARLAPGRPSPKNANTPREGLDRRVNADSTRGQSVDQRPRPGGSGPAARRFWNAVDVYVKAGRSVQESVREVATNDPALHAAFIREANDFFRAMAAAKGGKS